jgi:ABC-2 type transport system permease protein
MLSTLTKSSLKMFFRNKQALFFTLFSPLMIMLVFGLIGFDKPPRFDVGLVNYNPQGATREFINHLKEFPTFKVHEGTLDDELKELNEGNRAAVLEIPNDLIPESPEGAKVKTISTYLNEGQQAQAQTVLSVLNQYLDKTTLAVTNAPVLFKVEEKTVNSRNLGYFEFLLPGLIALSIMQMSVFSVAFAFAQYKEKGVLKRLLATPMNPLAFVSANVITRLVVAVLQTAIFLAVGILLFKAHVIGSYLLVLLCVILGALMFLGLGYTISGLSKTVETVPALANLIVFPMLFLGGTFFPVSNMPTWLQSFAKYLPLTYFSSALRDVMTKGAGLSDIYKDIIGMVIWGIILIFLATLTFSFQEKESA